MDKLIQLINEALTHDINYHGFKTTKDKMGFEGVSPSKLKGITDEHNHLVSLHKLPRKEEERSNVLEAITRYTSGSSDINQHLINTKGEDLRSGNSTINNTIGTLKDHISKAKPLEQDHHVYSGLGFDPSKHFMKDGKGVVHTPAFTSCSIHPEVGSAFSDQDDDAPVQHVIHFHLPKGYNKGVYIAKHSTLPREKEFLLAPNQKWKLTSHHELDTHNYANPRWDDEPIIKKRHIWSVVPHDG